MSRQVLPAPTKAFLFHSMAGLDPGIQGKGEILALWPRMAAIMLNACSACVMLKARFACVAAMTCVC